MPIVKNAFENYSHSGGQNPPDSSLYLSGTPGSNEASLENFNTSHASPQFYPLSPESEYPSQSDAASNQGAFSRPSYESGMAESLVTDTKTYRQHLAENKEAYSALVGASALDYATTRHFMAHPELGITEGNPIVDKFMQEFGIDGGLTAAKLLGIAGTSAILYGFYDRKKGNPYSKYITPSLILAAGVLGAVGLNNLRLIIEQGGLQ